MPAKPRSIIAGDGLARADRDGPMAYHRSWRRPMRRFRVSADYSAFPVWDLDDGGMVDATTLPIDAMAPSGRWSVDQPPAW